MLTSLLEILIVKKFDDNIRHKTLNSIIALRAYVYFLV